MTEQEATELIATKLMGWYKNKKHDWWMYNKGRYRVPIENFAPFHDSNDARMVKDEIMKKGLEYRYIYIQVLHEKYKNEHNENSLPLFHYFHFMPDDVCMWAVVDVIKEMDKEGSL